MLNELYLVSHDKAIICLNERDNEWMREVSNYLREELTQNTLPSVMNVSEVRLAANFNFYHDSLP